MTHMTTDTRALDALHRARQNLRAARIDAVDAAGRLCGARATRADELSERIADALAFVERLCFFVEAENYYEEIRDR